MLGFIIFSCSVLLEPTKGNHGESSQGKCWHRTDYVGTDRPNRRNEFYLVVDSNLSLSILLLCTVVKGRGRYLGIAARGTQLYILAANCRKSASQDNTPNSLKCASTFYGVSPTDSLHMGHTFNTERYVSSRWFRRLSGT